MKIRTLDVLRCPECGGSLKLHVFKKVGGDDLPEIEGIKCSDFCNFNEISIKDVQFGAEKIDCSTCYATEVVDGLLECECGRYYPVIGGVPRMLPDSIFSDGEFLRKYSDSIPKIEGVVNKNSTQGTKKSFTAEWGIFKYSDKTWGWDIKTRKELFLTEMGLEEPELNGKTLFDAGCGNGTLSSAITEFGLEVFAMDLSHSVDRAYENKEKFSSKSEFVHFIQGDLLRPPFKNEAFDYIYSSGVLHHTPSTEEAFNSIVPLLKNKGRMYAWIYRKRRISIVVDTFRRFTTKLPLRLLSYMCYVAAPLFEALKLLLTYMGKGPYPKRSLRENALSLFDTYSPPYAYKHTVEEVESWFTKNNFKNVTLTNERGPGFGIIGDHGK